MGNTGSAGGPPSRAMNQSSQLAGPRHTSPGLMQSNPDSAMQMAMGAPGGPLIDQQQANGLAGQKPGMVDKQWQDQRGSQDIRPKSNQQHAGPNNFIGVPPNMTESSHNSGEGNDFVDEEEEEEAQNNILT